MSDGFRRLSGNLRQFSRNLRRMDGQHTLCITLPKDENGFIGRECPQSNCLGYFKVKPGTGLSGDDLDCHCPYCGHTEKYDSFHTSEQIEYARSMTRRHVADLLHSELKRMEFRSRPSGPLSLSISVEVKRGHRPALHRYREKELETEVVCESCTLHYAIYGVFGYCADCGSHNSLQILNKNLELAKKEIALAATLEGDLAVHLTGDALENAVSAFDGFGRETCRVRAAKAAVPARAENISFQNLVGVRQRLVEQFGYDLATQVPLEDWEFACRCFQKRHLLAHKMGVVDDAYLQATGDTRVVVGRKVVIEANEVIRLVAILKMMGAHLIAHL